MQERIARIKTYQEALQFAQNARRLGHLELAEAALSRSTELKALEEGFSSPAQQAIAKALYAYEEQQSATKGRKFRANRTRQMLAKHGSLIGAERMVLHKQPSKGYEVLEDAGLQELSFEAIIDRFPNEFSATAVDAARARLEGRPPPAKADPRSAVRDEIEALPVLDGEAEAFLDGFQNPSAWFLAEWMPAYQETLQNIRESLENARPEELFEVLWKQRSNAISNAGKGVLSYDIADRNRGDLIQVIRDIAQDGSPESFERIVRRFEAWKVEGRLDIVPRLLIARAFAGIHPNFYHTTVDASSQRLAIEWFVEHTGFTKPTDKSWAASAKALTSHLSKISQFALDVVARNIFPWFVVNQVLARKILFGVSPGHSPRTTTAFAATNHARRAISLRHNAVQTALFAQLAEQFGAEKVWTECATGTGGYADALVCFSDGRCYLYEIKIARTASDVVRQAMGQLLEYGFRQGGLEPAKLFVVGEPPLDEITSRFLKRLAADFNLPIDYLQVGADAE